MNDVDFRCVWDETLTLEGIDIEALVVPVKIFILKCTFNLISLRTIWCDYSIRNAIILEMSSNEHNCIDFFLVLKTASGRG